MPGGEDTINTVVCNTPELGPSSLQRLRHREYDNSVRDLLGLELSPGESFAPDNQVGLFDNTASAQTVSVLLAEQYVGAAEELALAADVDGLLGCSPDGAAGATCVGDFVARFGRRAFRRPLSDDERDRLLALHAEVSAASDSRMGVRGVITAVLSSPNFLFRPEFGMDAAPVPDGKRLTSYELAARLASLLWASVPDEALLEAAATDAIQEPSELEAQTRRMLADPRARAAMADFYDQWFGLDALESATKDPGEYPSFTESLRDAMGEETRRYVDHVLWEDDARLATLLTAPYSFVNDELAEHYGLDAGCAGAAAPAPTALAWDDASTFWSPAPDGPA
ncbi:MAG: DUF1592 domain-containing protein, partial [Myxococcales bacterium]|nr:DUF1592 domain-containing protein [Myxococcales bacterium]